jgi:glycosyltransferase involved in cell wall biosynthesis
VIIDNESIDETAQVVREFCSSNVSGSVTYQRNPINIGGNANILRCFEVGSGDWLWILGDDDLPSPDAVTQVLATIQMYPAAYYINFETTLSRLHAGTRINDVTCTSIESLCQSMDCFPNFLFISAGVYRVDAIKPYLPVGYQNISTYGPHVAMILSKAAASTGETAVFAKGMICNWEPNLRGDHWDIRIVGPSLQGLVNLVPTMVLKRNLSEMIRINHPSYEISDLRALDPSQVQSASFFLQDHVPDIARRAACQGRLISFAFLLLLKSAAIQFRLVRCIFKLIKPFYRALAFFKRQFLRAPAFFKRQLRRMFFSTSRK